MLGVVGFAPTLVTKDREMEEVRASVSCRKIAFEES